MTQIPLSDEALSQAIEQIGKDAARYRWLKARLYAADFAYGEPAVCALIFEAPDDILVSADLDETIDAAITAPNESP
jgi:hypothetical protein